MQCDRCSRPRFPLPACVPCYGLRPTPVQRHSELPPSLSLVNHDVRIPMCVCPCDHRSMACGCRGWWSTKLCRTSETWCVAKLSSVDIYVHLPSSLPCHTSFPLPCPPDLLPRPIATTSVASSLHSISDVLGTCAPSPPSPHSHTRTHVYAHTPRPHSHNPTRHTHTPHTTTTTHTPHKPFLALFV